MGRTSVDPLVRQAIGERDRKMEGLFHNVTLTKDDKTAPAVICRNASELLQRVIDHRQVDPHNHFIKLGMDGGGGMMKVTCNIIENEDSNNNKEARASTSASSRDTGVKRLLLLAVAPGMPETYQLMSELLQHIRLSDIGGLIVASDLKMANIVCGLQVSKTNTFFFTFFKIFTTACAAQSYNVKAKFCSKIKIGFPIEKCCVFQTYHKKQNTT